MQAYVTTRAQREAIHALYLKEIAPSREWRYPGSYRQYRRRFKPCDWFGRRLEGSYLGCRVFNGTMFVGVERDGYTHS
jgi:hypothetical protein